MPAIERYTGVLFEALEHHSMSAVARKRASSSLLVVSGLWGLVAPDDPIPEYRLKMGTALPKLGKLATWWKDHLTQAIDVLGKGRIVWDLLQNEHAMAFGDSEAFDRIVVRFLERRSDGRLSAVSHWNKPLKASLVRHMLYEPPEDVDDLKSWRHPSGFKLDPSLTQHRGRSTTICFVVG